MYANRLGQEEKKEEQQLYLGLLNQNEELVFKELSKVAQLLNQRQTNMISCCNSVVNVASSSSSSSSSSQQSKIFDSNMNVVMAKPSNPVATTTITDTERFVTNLMVKSSAHVSFIVGKQGSKIRQIRNETGTVIQTPVNGEEPLFKIRGTKERVLQAKLMIENAANEFDKNILLEASTFRDGNRIRNNLFLPARFIGLVVGTRGSIIKRIMETSGTVIITPKVNTLNGFKIDGTPEQIRHAIDLIKDHILRTSHVEIVEKQDNQYEITLAIKDLY